MSLRLVMLPLFVLLVARPEADPLPELRARAAGLRLPGDS